MSGIAFYNAYKEDGNKIGENTFETTGEIAGEIAGGYLGAQLSKASILVLPTSPYVAPIAATIVTGSGIIGSAMGSELGGMAGSWIYDTLVEKDKAE